MMIASPPSSRRTPQSRRYGSRPTYQAVHVERRLPATPDPERHAFHLRLNAFNRPRFEPAGPARNYWDEMGRGKSHGMHGPMLNVLARAIHVENTPPEELVWESIALANAMCGLAFQRQYAFHSVGALGVIELTAPTRAKKVARG